MTANVWWSMKFRAPGNWRTLTSDIIAETQNWPVDTDGRGHLWRELVFRAFKGTQSFHTAPARACMVDIGELEMLELGTSCLIKQAAHVRSSESIYCRNACLLLPNVSMGVNIFTYWQQVSPSTFWSLDKIYSPPCWSGVACGPPGCNSCLKLVQGLERQFSC